MIDGAHVLTPGVLHYGLAGLATYAPAIVATQQWYVGPGQQGEVMRDGYDQAYEDRLFESIRWPSAGHRLFEISHFIGDRDWLDGMWESNCMFVPRAQLAQVGGFDESFTVAGGGYTNLELYERLGASPDVTVCTIMGEGSFHQVHGGTTTNQTDVGRAPLTRLRLQPGVRRAPRPAVQGSGQADPFRRSHPERGRAALEAPADVDGGVRRGRGARWTTGCPTSRSRFPTSSGGRSPKRCGAACPWTSTTWLGAPIATAPTDLLAYQEIIATVRPDWVIETGTGDGGARAVPRVDVRAGRSRRGRRRSVRTPAADLPAARRSAVPRRGGRTMPATAAAVGALVGCGRALVVLGSCRRPGYDRARVQRVRAARPGGVVRDRHRHDRQRPSGVAARSGRARPKRSSRSSPVTASSSPTPAMEKYSLTFNPGGFLHRVR